MEIYKDFKKDLFCLSMLVVITLLFFKSIIFNEYFHHDDLAFYAWGPSFKDGISDGRSLFLFGLFTNKSFEVYTYIKSILILINSISIYLCFILFRRNNKVYSIAIALLPLICFYNVINLVFITALLQQTLQSITVITFVITLLNKDKGRFQNYFYETLWLISIFITLITNQLSAIFILVIMVTILINEDHYYKKVISLIKKYFTLLFVYFILFFLLNKYLNNQSGRFVNSFNGIYDKFNIYSDLIIKSGYPFSPIPSDYSFYPILIIPFLVVTYILFRRKRIQVLIFYLVSVAMLLSVGFLAHPGNYRVWWPLQALLFSNILYLLINYMKIKYKELIISLTVIFFIILNSVFLDGFIYERKLEFQTIESQLLNGLNNQNVSSLPIKVVVELPKIAKLGGGALSQEDMCKRVPCTSWGEFTTLMSSPIYWGNLGGGVVSGYATNYILYISKKHNLGINRENIIELDKNNSNYYENKKKYSESIIVELESLVQYHFNHSSGEKFIYKYLPMIIILPYLIIILIYFISYKRILRDTNE